MNPYRAHVSVLGCWAATFVVAIAVYVIKPWAVGGSLQYYFPHFKSVVAMITPQVVMIAAFFFKMSPEERAAAMKRDPHVTKLAVVVTVAYNLLFVLLLVAGVGCELLGEQVERSTEYLRDIMTVAALVALPAVSSLFAVQAHERRE